MIRSRLSDGESVSPPPKETAVSGIAASEDPVAPERELIEGEVIR